MSLQTIKLSELLTYLRLVRCNFC